MGLGMFLSGSRGHVEESRPVLSTPERSICGVDVDDASARARCRGAQPYAGRVTHLGRFADGRTYSLPEGWEPFEEQYIRDAVAQTRRALDIGPGLSTPAIKRLSDYYHPESRNAGALFNTVEPNDDAYIGAADLWAVSTLSMERFVTPLVGRRLLDPGPARTNVTRQLRRLPPYLPITDIDADTLATMYQLHQTLRGIMSEDDHTSVWWVFASKLCARKRPQLFPVRDNKVCTYLSAGRGMGRQPGQLGQFDRDIQVFAYLMASPDIRARLTELYEELRSTPWPRASTEVHDLRLLDVALWTAATMD